MESQESLWTARERAWVTGATTSPDYLLTSNALLSTLDGTSAGFLAELADNSPTGPTFSSTGTTSSATLTASPMVLRFSAVAGKTTATQEISVASKPSVSFTAVETTTNGGSWLSIIPQRGTTPEQLTISADATALTAGIYFGTIELTPVGGSAITVDVALQVTPSAPIITGTSPAVIPVGSNNTLVTLVGSGFTPATQVAPVFMGFALPPSLTPVTYVNPATIQVTLPSILFWQPGRAQIEVANSSTGPWTPVTITVR